MAKALSKIELEMREERKAIKEQMEVAGMEEKEEEKSAKAEAKKKVNKFGKRVHVTPSSIHLRCEFIEPILGSNPGSQQVASDYVSKLAPDAKSRKEEVELYGEEDVEDTLTTKFYQQVIDGRTRYYLLTYQIEGFLKAAAEALKRAGQVEVTAFKKTLNQIVFASGSPGLPIERKIEIIRPPKTGVTTNQRPLKASTPKGDRTALASSEELPKGSKFELWIHLLDPRVADYILSLIEYGELSGISQWRNAGYGRFHAEVEVAPDVWEPVRYVDSADIQSLNA